MQAKKKTTYQAPAVQKAFEVLTLGAESRSQISLSDLLAGAVGKVFLAQQRDDQALKIIGEHGLPQSTPRSIVNPQDYLTELAQVRRQGYAVDEKEYLPGVKAVAVAVGNQRGGVPLAIWVVGFADSMGKRAVPDIVAETGRAATRLRESLERRSQDES